MMPSVLTVLTTASTSDSSRLPRVNSNIAPPPSIVPVTVDLNTRFMGRSHNRRLYLRRDVLVDNSNGLDGRPWAPIVHKKLRLPLFLSLRLVPVFNGHYR